MSESLFRRAPAKVNLALAVGQVDPNGSDPRHPICSWMVRVSLCDDLYLTQLPLGSLSRYALIWAADAAHKPDIDWPIRTDLAVRAHLLLCEAVGRDLPVQMKIEKRIPLGAGLGGGSSDAAAMLLACNDLFNLRLGEERLTALAARLGSDVPFFIRHRSAVIEGFGERLTAAREPRDLNLVLCLPPYGCATAEVYRRFDEQDAGAFEQGAARVRLAAQSGRFEAEAGFNDLAAPAFALRPELRELAAAVADLAERPVHLTGSGAALFVACDSAMEAEALARAVSERLGAPALAVTLDEATNDALAGRPENRLG